MPFLFQIQFAGGLILAKIIQWQGDDTFEQEVVGEAHYQETLRKLAGGERRKYTTARLVCESDNKFDAQSVRVEIGGKTIGHLSRDDARAHRVLLRKSRQTGALVELPAVIVTGERGVSGVYLSVSEADVSALLNASKAAVSAPISDRVLMLAVVMLACIGITLIVVGFGGVGGPGVQPTVTPKRGLSEILKVSPIGTEPPTRVPVIGRHPAALGAVHTVSIGAVHLCCAIPQRIGPGLDVVLRSVAVRLTTNRSSGCDSPSSDQQRMTRIASTAQSTACQTGGRSFTVRPMRRILPW